MTAMEERFEQEAIKSHVVFIPWRWFIIALLVIISVPVVALIIYISRGSDLQRGNSALVEAFANRRFIEPRLSGGFKGAEFNPSGNDKNRLDKNLDRASDLIRGAVAKGDPKAQLFYGRLLLCEGEKLPVASKYLRRAVETSPNAEAHNDLGVCLIEQGNLEDALDQFKAALNLNSQMKEALFNKALCYEKLQLREIAAAGYAELANLEPDKGWLREIRQKSDKLAQPANQPSYTDTAAALDSAFSEGRIDYLRTAAGQRSEWVWHHALMDLVNEYLQATVNNDRAKADLKLRELTSLGDLLAELYGDTEIVDEVRYLKSLPENEVKTELALVTEFVAATRSADDHRSTYKRLRDEFERRGNAVFQINSCWDLAVGMYLESQLVESANTLRSMLPVLMKHEWKYERRLFTGQLGQAYSRLGQDSLAISYFTESLNLSRQLHASEAKPMGNMSLPYWHIGDFDKALSYLRGSIAGFLEEGRKLNELAFDYLQLADIYRLRDRPDLALLYAMESLKFADREKHYKYAAQASSFVAVEHARLGDFQEAEENLKLAFSNVNSIADVKIANAYSRPLVFTRAAEVSYRSGDITRALRYCDEAEKLVSVAQENKLPLVRVYLARTDSLIAAGRPKEARSTLERALEALEGYRTNIASIEERQYFLETSQSVFDRLINLNLDEAGRDSQAFDLSERSRARALLEEISTDAGVPGNPEPQSNEFTPGDRRRPAKLTAIQQLLPEDVTLVEYSVTDRATFIFLVTRSTFRVARSAATSASLDKLVNDYLSDLKNAATRDDTQSRAELSAKALLLYQQLIEPIGALPEKGTRICVVPDKSLHFLPFAALQDSGGTYLIQNYVLTYAPSASVLLLCNEQSIRRHRNEPEKIFAVGNPKFDRDYFRLDYLPGAEREALESAKCYQQRQTLISTAATRSAVLANVADCDVAHFASHCLVNNSSPWRAALVLASTRGDKTDLAANGAASARVEQGADETHQNELLALAELSRVHLSRTKLVVLSACQTGLGRYFKGEGMVSLVRPFIASGVPSVVASLWSVDSQATYELMVRFHQQRTTTTGTVGAGDALRAAQLKLIEGEFQHPYYWATFIAVGR